MGSLLVNMKSHWWPIFFVWNGIKWRHRHTVGQCELKPQCTIRRGERKNIPENPGPLGGDMCVRLSPEAAVAEHFIARCSAKSAGHVQVFVGDAAPLRGRG